ncbi:MAG: arginyltransferase [Methyloligellaceae bacterium]
MTQHKNSFPDFYITASQSCPYLPDRQERKLFTHLSKDKPAPLIDNLLKGGFRRSQNIAYMPYCDTCCACISIRILVDEFEPKRSIKRAWNINQDLTTARVPPVPTSEQYSLFRDYIEARHADGGMADMSVLEYSAMVEETAVNTFLTEYRMPENEYSDSSQLPPLAAVALCDQLSDGISLVYSFYAPELQSRSLGTHIIVDHIEYARNLGLPYAYLGYWIKGSGKMEYKSRFQPQEHLTSQGWRRA